MYTNAILGEIKDPCIVILSAESINRNRESYERSSLHEILR